MSVDEWYASRQGQSLLVPGADPADTGQCVQAADYALNEIYGLPYVWLNAIQWWTSPQVLQNFDQITDGSIKKGDFVIFNQNVGSVYGHISLAMGDGTIDNFTSADSNWSNNKTVHLVNHVGRQYVLGSLRLKNGEIMPIANYGDILNSFQAVYNVPIVQGDIDYWTKAVNDNQMDFKTLFYAMMNSQRYSTEAFINSGDAANLKAKGIDVSSAVGQMWKPGMYLASTTGAAPDFKKYDGPELYEKE